MNLTNKDLEISRSASEMLPWVLIKLEELGNTDEGKKAIRLTEGPAKYLVEESLPIAIFAQRHFGQSPYVHIRQVIGSQNYDAIITDERKEKSPIKYLEVTQNLKDEKEGLNEVLKMIELNRNKSVYALKRFPESKNKKTGKLVDVKNESKSHNDILNEELSRIVWAINRKCNKTEPYPDGTALLIPFDDILAIRSSEEVHLLDQMVKKNFISKLTGFRWFALVGWSNRFYLEYDLKKDLSDGHLELITNNFDNYQKENFDKCMTNNG